MLAWRTLKGQFTLQAGLILLFTAVVTLIGAITLSMATGDLTIIDSDSIPSVDAAQTITQDIELIDAQSADYLATAGLSVKEPCSIAGGQASRTLQDMTVHDCDKHNIDSEIVLVNQQLFEIAHNTTYPGEHTAVERISIGLEGYLADIQQMRTDYDLASSKSDPQDPSLREAYQAYLAASDILHNRISLSTLSTGEIPFNSETNLPSCTLPNGQVMKPGQWTQGGLTDALDCLSAINYAHLQQAYNDAQNFLSVAVVLVSLCYLLLCGLLIFSTGRMIAISHRILNPGLLTAALIGLILSASTFGLLSSLQGQSTQASQDGAFKQLAIDDYNSIYDAALLKRYGTDSNADESRWLIAQEFADQSNIQRWQSDWENNVQATTSLMQRAQTNQTWNEEIQPLKNMRAAWDEYDNLDAQIRGTLQNGADPDHLSKAEALSTGQSNQAFARFTYAVDQLAQANRKHYSRTLQNTQDQLLRYFWLSLILIPLAGLLAVLGISMRMKDL